MKTRRLRDVYRVDSFEHPAPAADECRWCGQGVIATTARICPAMGDDRHCRARNEKRYARRKRLQRAARG